MSWSVPEEDILVSDLASISTHAAENLETHTHHGCGGQGSDRGERGSVRKIKLTGKTYRGLSLRDNNSGPSDCSSLPALALPLKSLIKWFGWPGTCLGDSDSTKCWG